MQGREKEILVEKIVVLPPDGGWGWVVVVSAFFCIFIMDGISNTFGLLIPIFQKEFNATVSQISVINSLFTGFYFIFAPIAGSLSNRFGFRCIIIAGSMISSFGIAVSVFTDNVELMSATYGLIGGLGFSLMYLNVVLTVGFYFEKWRALATGITVSASGVGTMSFAPVVEILLEKYTWRHVFVGYSCLVFSCALAAICFRPLPAITIQHPDKGALSQLERATGKKIISMHNTRYPTAAEALELNVNQLKDSKINLMPSWYSSSESLELSKYNSSHTSRKASRNVEARRPTEFSQFESYYDMTLAGTSNALKFPSNQKTCCMYSWYGCKKGTNCCKGDAGVRPLYREDIFYEGSLVHLPNYEKNSVLMKSTGTPNSVVMKSSLLYHLSVSRLPTYNDIAEEREGKCVLCPESFTRALKTLFDFRVMKYRGFLLFTISTCFLATGVNVPCFFTYVRALGMGKMKEKDGSLILTAMGVTNTLGRIICGLLGSLPKINMVILHFSFLFFGALINVCVVFLDSKEAFFAYAALFGFVLAEQGSLRSVILVQLVGLENLTNAFGILLLFLGIFTIAGTPAAGYMKELYGNYDAVFFFSSFFLFLAALTLIPLLFGKPKFLGSEAFEPPQLDQNTAQLETAVKGFKREERITDFGGA